MRLGKRRRRRPLIEADEDQYRNLIGPLATAGRHCDGHDEQRDRAQLLLAATVDRETRCRPAADRGLLRDGDGDRGAGGGL